jgi:hypothetical protein
MKRYLYASGSQVSDLDQSMSKYFQVLEKLESFATLEEGWHYGTGSPISAETIANAREAMVSLLGYGVGRIEVVPGVECEVVVFGRKDDLEIECAVYATDGVSILLDQMDWEEPLELSAQDPFAIGLQIEKALDECGTSVSPIRNITCHPRNGSRAQRFKSRRREGPRSSNWRALKGVGMASASTFEGITPPERPVIPPYFSSSTRTSFQMVAR